MNDSAARYGLVTKVLHCELASSAPLKGRPTEGFS